MSDLMMAIGGQTAGFIAEQWMRVSSIFGLEFLRSFLPMNCRTMVSNRSNTQERPVLWCEYLPIFFDATMYHNDSQAFGFINFSFNAQSGSWVDKRVFFQFGNCLADYPGWYVCE